MSTQETFSPERTRAADADVGSRSGAGAGASGGRSGSLTAQVLAVVVCYEPQHRSLDSLLGALSPSDKISVLLVDNSESAAGRDCVAAVAGARNAELVANSRNLGVAEAHNIGIRCAKAKGCTHVLLLDQDSAIDALSIEQMLSAYWVLKLSGRKVGALGPSVVDQRTKTAVDFVRLGRLRMKRLPRTSEPVSCDMLISSGCLIAIDAIDAAGLMDSSFFIDYVDMEWCSRARRAGYEVLGLPDVTMLHHLGNACLQVAGRSIAVHAPVRSYYLVRNALLFARKPHLTWRWRAHLVYRAVGHLALFSLFFPNRLDRLGWMLRGILDGLIGNAGRLGGFEGLGRTERERAEA